MGRVPRVGQIEPRHRQVRHIESRLHAACVMKAAKEQPRPREAKERIVAVLNRRFCRRRTDWEIHIDLVEPHVLRGLACPQWHRRGNEAILKTEERHDGRWNVGSILSNTETKWTWVLQIKQARAGIKRQSAEAGHVDDDHLTLGHRILEIYQPSRRIRYRADKGPMLPHGP